MTRRLRTILAAAAIGWGSTARAQQTPGDTGTVDFEVDHVHVILRHNGANDVVAANVYLLGGTQELTPQTQGIETLMLAASGGGTARFPKAQLQAITARSGATVVITTGVDWTTFGLRTLRQSFDSSWAVFADRLTEPTLDSIEVDRSRQQMLTDALQGQVAPDAMVEHLADSLLYAGHPYRLDPSGTPASLNGLTFRDVRRFHDQRVVQTRLLVVVVGNIDRGRLERAIRGTLATLPVGDYTWKAPAPLTPAVSGVAVSAQRLPTNYILGYAVGPPAGTPEYFALRVATAVLSGRLFADVRARQHLAYAVDAPFLERAISADGLYVTTTDPQAALRAMALQVRQLQTTLVDPEGLRTLVGAFITDYYLKNETNADQASVLARAQLYEGDYRNADRFIARLRDVTPDDVQRAAQEYMRDYRFGYVGDPAKVPVPLGGSF
ncbi:MAG: insulinase family protein [Gemmatimonadota bacterium]|nr:insulinase family protein [Gemmatimonadota bacterium]MDE3126381.1 insulinase family protein [Gemmatimonadota bacterium]MDE3171480.1 insulinase family protein [Gemmatimonadota bacterium]MDE3215077.1 insulinase family protein [Gemmatimonadota bacterium]